jgi:cytosine deaminase
MPRGVTAVRALRKAGVTVCAGADNLQDPFNPLGRGDPLETAGLMIATAHLLPEQALDAVGASAMRAMGVETPALEPGGLADLVALGATTVREAIAFGPTGRWVWHRGRIVQRPTTCR